MEVIAVGTRKRSYDRLAQLEQYTYGRWLRTLSPVWHRLGAACNAAVKAHPQYRGAR